MATLTARTRDGRATKLDTETLGQFTAGLRGALLTPGSDGYDASRTIWNAMIDRKPGLIVECAGAADVARAVRFARQHDLLVSVRSGGHNIAGSAVCDGGMMISLASMKSVRVDPVAHRAWVEPGNTLGDVDKETQAYALALPVGINSTTGIAGLTLGGGFGWLSRKHGLTIDSLLSADVVTADGTLVRASAHENPELFWGIRGGGGNFGIVTAFEFALHPVGPEVISGLIVHPIAAAPEVLRYYRDFCAKAPDELTVWAVMRKAPPLPFLPPEVHGTEVLVLAALYAGPMADGEKALAPLRAIGKPIADVISPHPFIGFQAAFDPLLTPGARNYWKSHDFLALEDGLLDTLVEYVGTLPDPQCEIFIAQMGGATNRVAADDTAYRHRDAQFVMNVHGRWDSAKNDDRCISWCRSLFDAASPYATGGVYVNFMTEEEDERVQAAYGASYQRLVELKRKFDPTNLFRLNQNIRPDAAA
ncbi:MAG: FAD-binding oxidoreductase [Gemmatimonadales bacterium]|nr:FAD-binding oxidoreductase [Gemmatimonadales bacterium]